MIKFAVGQRDTGASTHIKKELSILESSYGDSTFVKDFRDQILVQQLTFCKAFFGLTANPGGLKANQATVAINGRRLSAPGLRYANAEKPGTPSQLVRGGWNMYDKRFAVAKKMPSWSVLMVGSSLRDKSFVEVFRKTLQKCELEMTDQQKLERNRVDPSDEEALRKSFRSAQGSKIGLFWVILANEDADIYSRIKLMADIEFGNHSQLWF